MMRQQRFAIVCLLAVALAAMGDGVYIIQKYHGKLGTREAGGYLMILGAILACLTLVHLFQSGKSKSSENEGAPESNRRVWLALASFVVYALLFDFLGYLISTTIFLVIYLRIFGFYRWLPVLVGSVGAAALSAWLWATVGLMLPQGILPWP